MPRNWPHPLDPEPTPRERRWARIGTWTIGALIVASLIASIVTATGADARRKRAAKRVRPVTVRTLASADRTYRSCAEARAAGAAPVRRGSAGYSRRLDRDGDGVGCE